MANKKISYHDLMKAALDSLNWTVLTTFLGLIQLWITVIISYLLTNKEYNFYSPFQDGSLLFFIMAVTTAITIDYHFTKNINLPQWAKSVVFTLFPFLIGILVTALYSTFYIADDNELHLSGFMVIQYFVIGCTIIYVFVAKFLMFLEEVSRT